MLNGHMNTLPSYNAFGSESHSALAYPMAPSPTSPRTEEANLSVARGVVLCPL